MEIHLEGLQKQVEAVSFQSHIFYPEEQTRIEPNLKAQSKNLEILRNAKASKMIVYTYLANLCFMMILPLPISNILNLHERLSQTFLTYF